MVTVPTEVQGKLSTPDQHHRPNTRIWAHLCFRIPHFATSSRAWDLPGTRSTMARRRCAEASGCSMCCLCRTSFVKLAGFPFVQSVETPSNLPPGSFYTGGVALLGPTIQRRELPLSSTPIAATLCSGTSMCSAKLAPSVTALVGYVGSTWCAPASPRSMIWIS